MQVQEAPAFDSMSSIAPPSSPALTPSPTPAVLAAMSTLPLNGHSSPSSMATITPTAIHPANDPNPSWTFFPPSATYFPPTTTTTSTAHAPTSPTFPLSRSPSHPTSRPSSPPPPIPSVTTQSPSENNKPNSNSTPSSTAPPSTHHRILDHCFHLSIETRLKQAEAQYLASIQEQAQVQAQEEAERQAQTEGGQPKTTTNEKGSPSEDWRRRQRSLVDEAVVLGRKGSNVEAIVDGILKSHRSNGPLQTLPRHLKHRLHLCQLTSMVFGRFDVASSTNNSAGLNIYSAFHSRRHGASRLAIKQRFASTEKGRRIQRMFDHPISSTKKDIHTTAGITSAAAGVTSAAAPGTIGSSTPQQHASYCRRHHRRDCKRTCCTLAKLQQEQQQALELKKKMANHHYYLNHVDRKLLDPSSSMQRKVAGLVDAIPAFLKCSAMSYRDIANHDAAEKEKEGDKDEGKANEDKKEVTKKSTATRTTKVLEGWYRLLLEMMTQAVIESYLCDETTGLDTILDVFSFGDDPEDVLKLTLQFEVPDDLDEYHGKDAESTTGSDSIHEDETGSAATMGVEGLQFQNLNNVNHHHPHSVAAAAAAASASGLNGVGGPGTGSGGPGLHDVTTQDRQDDILFAKGTPEYEAFKVAKKARLEEMLNLEGVSVEQHFADLAAKYPLIVFERQMTHFIARSQKLLVDPKLSQNVGQMGLLIPPTTSAYADGSLSMPVSEDEDDEMEEEGVKLEEIEEEEDGDDMEDVKDHRQGNRTIDEQKQQRRSSWVRMNKRRQDDGLSKPDCGNDGDQEEDDDHSTAARVSKKHQKVKVKKGEEEKGVDKEEHIAKKVKV